MPVYNAEKYLELAVGSILSQTFSDFELICVNDGSIDRSPEILRRLASEDRRIRVIDKANGGIVSALNFGLPECQGRYIARMDGDDIAPPDRFEIQLKEFDRYRDAVAVGGLIVGMDEHGRHTGVPISPSRVVRTNLDTFPPSVANVQHSAGTFVKAAMLQVGGYRNTFPHAEDYDLYLRLAPLGTFRNPRHVVLYYRNHVGAVSVQNMAQQETSSALAELSAVARQLNMVDPGDSDLALDLQAYGRQLGSDVCPVPVLERYIQFRIWRRIWGRSSPEEAYRRKVVLKGLLDPRSYLTTKGRSLNLRIGLSIARRQLKRMRKSVITSSHKVGGLQT